MLNRSQDQSTVLSGANMSIGDDGYARPQTTLEAQINLILHGIPGVEEGLEGAAAYPPDWRERGSVDVDYLHRERSILVRDDHVERVRDDRAERAGPRRGQPARPDPPGIHGRRTAQRRGRLRRRRPGTRRRGRHPRPHLLRLHGRYVPGHGTRAGPAGLAPVSRRVHGAVRRQRRPRRRAGHRLAGLCGGPAPVASRRARPC